MIAQGVLVLALAHAILAKVSPDFYGCKDHFYKREPPVGFIGNLTAICQMYENYNNTFFATLYDNTHRFGLYSAYIVDTSAPVGDRHDITFKVEPQLLNAELLKYKHLNPLVINQALLDAAIPNQMMLQRDIENKISKLISDLKNDQSINIQRTAGSLMKAVQAINSDYEGSGYDKGHLNPRAHHPYGAKQNATFTLTNVAPMNSTLNSVLWNGIEQYVKDIAHIYCTTMYVVTGVVPGREWISSVQDVPRVNIPSEVWSAYCCLNQNNQPIRAGGFLAPNNGSEYYIAYDNIAELQDDLSINMKTNLNLFYNNCTTVMNG